MSVAYIAALTSTFTSTPESLDTSASSTDSSTDESLLSAVTSGTSSGDMLSLSSGVEGIMDELEHELLLAVTGGESEGEPNTGLQLGESSEAVNELGASPTGPAVDAAGSVGSSLDTSA